MPRDGSLLLRSAVGALATLTVGGCALLPFRMGSGAPSDTPPAAVPSIPAIAGVRVAAVGDMVCRILCPRSGDVARLIEGLHPDALVTMGDLLNNTSDWSVYDADWGVLKPITVPVVGNHEYTAGIEAYDAYWGPAAHAPDRWFSLDLGTWHVVALNGETDVAAGSPQEAWFREDLAAHPAACTMVLIHEPRWSSAEEHPSDPLYQDLWTDAVTGGVDLWLAGHDHLYERFEPLGVDGLPDPAGTAQFVIATGGRQLHGFSGEPLPGEAARDNDTYGTGLFTLGDGAWTMEFVPIPGGTYTDRAEGTCH